MTRPVLRLGPDGTPEETFYIRISDEGFAEWARDREVLRQQGYPDRPPDVDTETLRAWLPHPGEEGHPYFNEHPVPSADERAQMAFPVLSIGWRGSDDSRMRLVLIADVDGGFVCEIQSDGGVGWEREYPKEMGVNAVWADVEEQIERLNETVENADPDAMVRVTTYADYEAFDAEMLLARSEIEHGFQSLPAGPVQ